MTELYKKYRPRVMSEVKGQEVAVDTLRKFLANKSVPHALLFCGPSGCGKTTIARIVKRGLHCSDTDFREVNAAEKNGIDMVREIESRMHLSPMGGDTRIWLIDEAHQLTSQAQNAFLKILEDTPQHVYFMLATTAPEKLVETVKNRCTLIKLGLLKNNEISKLVEDVAAQEEIELGEDVLEAIIKHADGSARKALVILNQVAQFDDEEKQLAAIKEIDTQREAIDLCRLLIKPSSTWKEIAEVLRNIKGEPEAIRWAVLGYMTSILLKTKNDRAYYIIDAFRRNFFDSKKAGLAAACYEVVHPG